MLAASEARVDDRFSYVPADASASIRLRWTDDGRTMETRFRLSGFRCGVDVEDRQSERQTDGGSENRCTGCHLGHPLGCGPLSLERLGAGSDGSYVGRADR